jgi:GNAT superfamily N-acetyltransferase
MTVVSHRTVTEFWQTAGAVFTADPVRNTVALTVLGRLRLGGRFSDAKPIFLTVHDVSPGDPSGDHPGAVVGAALCTPPFPLAVSALPMRAVEPVIDHLLANDIRPDGVSGIRQEVEAFTVSWADRTGVRPETRMNQRLYRLGELVPPTGVAGEATAGTADDVGLLADWRAEFVREADGGRASRLTRSDLIRQIQDSLAAGNGHVVWRVDGRPVSMAAVSAPQSAMSRIGPVYTPREFRGHGYGSAVTASAAGWGLAKGARHVLLFTDLANPVSNSIYQRIGFVPFADALDVTFPRIRLP